MYLVDIKSANNDVIGLFGGGGERGLRLAGVASLGVVLDDASVTSICVSPEARGQGLGEALMVGLMRVVAERGATSVCLEVRADSNAPAVALYRKVLSAPLCGARPRACCYSRCMYMGMYVHTDTHACTSERRHTHIHAPTRKNLPLL
jgi:ribosomal protein S18 acetylase RimI-like enzyme